jgi:hypothetical protein
MENMIIKKQLQVFRYFLIISFSSVALQNLSAQPGSISSGAIRIDCDQMEPFQEGVAVVRKGDKDAVINRKGEFVVSYGSMLISSHGFKKGLCVVNNGSSKSSAIDTTGRLLLPFQFEIKPADEDGFLYVAGFTSKSAKYWLRRDGMKIPSKTARTYSNGLAVVRKSVKGDSGADPELLCGYVNRAGETVIDHRFLEARPFSEGLAVVEALDEGGLKRWGVIDIKGNTVIPVEWGYAPGNFHSGLSYVFSPDHKEFVYGYIDKTGAVRIKIKAGKNDRQIVETSGPSHLQQEIPHLNFQDGYVISMFKGKLDSSPFRILDTLGNVTEIKTNLFRHNSSEPYQIKNGSMLCENMGMLGLVNIRGELLLPNIFNDLSFFDPISGLAKASIMNEGQFVEGYINRDGVFVIIKATGGSQGK